MGPEREDGGCSAGLGRGGWRGQGDVVQAGGMAGAKAGRLGGLRVDSLRGALLGPDHDPDTLQTSPGRLPLTSPQTSL